jgi:hypothetical protein
MEKIVKVERFRQQGFTRLVCADGRSEDFTGIFCGLSFPREGTAGLILVGGQVRGTEAVKVLAEKEFQTASECGELIEDFESKFQPYCAYYLEGPENEIFAALLKRNEKSFTITSAKRTENINAAIPLINDYIVNNKLFVPKGGILAGELQRNWKSLDSEKRLHGIIALFCLLAGMLFDPRAFSLIDLDKCLV